MYRYVSLRVQYICIMTCSIDCYRSTLPTILTRVLRGNGPGVRSLQRTLVCLSRYRNQQDSRLAFKPSLCQIVSACFLEAFVSFSKIRHSCVWGSVSVREDPCVPVYLQFSNLSCGRIMDQGPKCAQHLELHNDSRTARGMCLHLRNKRKFSSYVSILDFKICEKLECVKIEGELEDDSI